ncbi:murein biosynthesis integral membrane protein MurJ [Exiguobacterium sp. s160]|uniref:murein biosynthesis integral membrane protein MurJ n=1 Tax=Exiguobacterium sp. s160 TaxID=2751265 RepID=UPI001BEBDA18|nr:murein biosynthesis integral membrane protein MurJ [Exiguobacterium sp. s160]
MKQTIIIIFCVTLISKVLGFFRDIVLAFSFGASTTSDIYLISLTIPEVLFAFVAVGISTSYIPIINLIENKHGEKRVIEFTNSLINSLIVIATIIIMLTVIFTEQIIIVFASGFQGAVLETAILYTRITVISIYFSGVIYVYKSLLQFKNIHVISASLGIPLNIIIIFSILGASKFDEIYLPFGFVLAVLLQLIILSIFVYKNKYYYQPKVNFRDKYLKRMMFLSLPIIMGLSINQINILVDRTLASQIVEGGIAALNYANKLNVFVQGIFIITISNLIYPSISKMALKKNFIGFNKVINDSISNVLIILAPSTVIFMLFSYEIIELLFGYGAFDEKAIILTSEALFYYSLGMIGFGLREVLSRGFYAFEDTKTPMKNAAISVAINILLNFVLSKYMGLNGLALATSISASIGTILLYFSFKKSYSDGSGKVIKIIFKPIIGSIVMGISCNFINKILLFYVNSFIALLISISMGLGIYLLSLWVMNVPQVTNFIRSLKQKNKY